MNHLIHFYDSKTQRGLCGAKLSDEYPSPDSSGDSAKVTCQKCLNLLPDAPEK